MIDEKVFRDYKGSDSFLRSENGVIRDIFLDNQPDFAAKDPTMTVAWATTWLNAITAAGAIVTDETFRDQMKTLRKAQELVMDKAALKYRDVMYFGSKAFAADESIQDELGQDDYDEASRDAGKMIAFLGIMKDACDDYAAELGTAGFTALQITEIITIQTELMAAHSLYQRKIRQRRKTTRQRIKAHNAVYVFTRQVEKAAYITYPTDPDERAQYDYKPNAGTNEDAHYILDNSINAGQTKQLIELDYVGTRTIEMEAKDADLTFGLSIDGVTTTGTTFMVQNGNKLTKVYSDFAAAGATWLLAINASGVLGKYKVLIQKLEVDEG